MHLRRKLLAVLALSWLPWPSFAQDNKVRRIGFLGTRSRSKPSDPDPYYDAFLKGLRELGYVEGKNIHIEWRFADGNIERLPKLAAELVAANVELIVTHGTPAVQVLQKTTNTIPIVMAAVIDPVGSGLVKSLAHPGGNITGMSNLAVDLTGKNIELLKILLPRLTRLAVLVNPGNPAHSLFLKSLQAAARPAGIKVMEVRGRTVEELEHGFETASHGRAGAIMIPPDSVFVGLRKKFAELALRHHLATNMPFREDVQAGALMSYGQDLVDYYRRTATYVDKILRGAKPDRLPIEQPTRFHLAVNRRTAKALGIAIPRELLDRADEVIE
jgi:putative ABC transport system substrate-binding protein